MTYMLFVFIYLFIHSFPEISHPEQYVPGCGKKGHMIRNSYYQLRTQSLLKRFSTFTPIVMPSNQDEYYSTLLSRHCSYQLSIKPILLNSLQYEDNI